MPRRLAEISVDLNEIDDLAGDGALERHGLPKPTPSSTTWASFQTVGEKLFEGGARGLVAPSAAREGGKVLCVFRPQPEIDGVEVVEISEISDIPQVPPGLRT